jgi:hypothetical protein
MLAAMASEAKLSGPLLWMVMSAAVLAIVGLAGLVLAFDQLRAIGSRYGIAVAFVTAWSLVFLGMTLLRMPATPLVASAGLVLWVAYRFCAALVAGGWPLIVDLLAEAVLAAGFCGYMLRAEQPNAYYRRGP